MPFQSWELRPHRTNACVLTIIAAIVEVEIEIKVILWLEVVQDLTVKLRYTGIYIRMNQEFILLLIFTETSVYCTTQYEIDQISKTLKCSFYLSVLMLLQFNHLVDYC